MSRLPGRRLLLVAIAMVGLIARQDEAAKPRLISATLREPEAPVRADQPLTEPARRDRLFAGASVADPTAIVSYLVNRPDEKVVTLASGLTVIVREHHTAPVASVRMYVKTGSAYEQEYLGAGISHLFEHLMHGRTTETRTEAETEKIISRLGNRSNAYTSIDHTCYFINTVPEDAGTAIELPADFVIRPAWVDREFEREWQVVQREIERSDRSPRTQIWYAMLEARYVRHPARFRTIGYRTAIQTLTKDDIIGYHRRMYVPDNVIVAVGGDFDADEMLEKVRTAFKEFVRRPIRDVPLPAEPPVGSPRTIVRNLATTPQVFFSVAFPTVTLTHPDLYALDVLAYVLGEGASSRLALEVRDKGLARSITCSSWTPAWGHGTFVISGVTAPKDWQACYAAILEQVRRAKHESPGEADLAKAKRQKIADHVFGMQTAEAVASAMARDMLTTGDPHFSDYYTELIQRVTAEQVLSAARRYLQEERICLALVGPPGFAPQPAGTTQPAAETGPIVAQQLDNGLTVLIKRQTAVPVVAMQFYMKGGQIGETAQQAGIHNMMAQLLTRGTKKRSAEGIAEFFDSIGGSISAMSGSHTVGVSCQLIKDDFESAFEVFADVIRNAAFPDKQLDIFRPIVVANIRRIGEDLESGAFDLLTQRFYLRSAYSHRRLGTIESVSGFTTEQIRDLYSRRLCGRDSVLAIVGDVQIESTMKQVRAAFGSLPKAPALPMPRIESDPPIEQSRLYVKKTSHAGAMLLIAYRGGTFTDEQDMAALDVVDTIISGYGYPSGWLHAHLRGEREGLVYAVHAFNQPGVVPRLFGAYGNCQPDKVSRVFQIMTDDLAKAARGEFTADELEEAKRQIITSEKMSNQTASEIAQRIAVNVMIGRPYDWDSPQNIARRVGAVTIEDARRAAGKYLTDFVAIVTTPEPANVSVGIEPVMINDERSTTAPVSATAK